MAGRAGKQGKVRVIHSDDRAFLGLFLNNARNYATLQTDRQGRIVDWNSSAQRLFRYTRKQIIGRSIRTLLPRGDRDRFRDCLGGKGTFNDGWWVRKDRSTFLGDGVCTSIRDERGRLAGLGLMIRDLTALNQADEDRRILASIVRNSEDAIIGKDLNGTVMKWNKSAERVFGYQADEIIGKSILLLIPPDRIKEERNILNRLRQGQRIHHYQTIRRRKDGKVIDVSLSVSPIRDASGKVTGASKIARDITEQKQAEAIRRRNEEMLQAILNSAGDAIISIDDRGIIQSANLATEQLFGYAPAELLGMNVKLLMPEPFRTEHDRYILDYCRTGRAKIIGIGREVTGLRKDGSTFPMHLAVSEVKLKGQRIFSGIVHDLTERRRLERQIMETAANEQRRIGQDLHDGLCQDLVGIAFGIDAAARGMPANADSASLNKLAVAVREAAGQARRLAHGLNPVDLKAGGLDMALQNMAAKVSESFQIHCTFHWDHRAQIHDDATATHLYRIAQEAIGNAIRHGKADKVEISFTDKNGYVSLAISDNGKGVPESLSETVKKGLVLSGPNKPTTGIGLQTMHYRARALGGAFSIAPRKEGGTTVICQIGRDRSFRSSKEPHQPSGNIRRRKRPPSR